MWTLATPPARIAAAKQEGVEDLVAGDFKGTKETDLAAAVAAAKKPLPASSSRASESVASSRLAALVDITEAASTHAPPDPAGL